jgi:hypothetical protein
MHWVTCFAGEKAALSFMEDILCIFVGDPGNLSLALAEETASAKAAAAAAAERRARCAAAAVEVENTTAVDDKLSR